MISTLRTLFRASAAEAEEALVEANGVRLLAQHLREAEVDIQRARHAIAAMVARQKVTDRRIAQATEEIARREAEAKGAMEAGQTDLSDDLVERIVMLEDTSERETQSRASLGTRLGELRANLAQAERRISVVATDLRNAKACQASRAANGRMANGLRTSALERAEDMASRVRETGQSIEDEMAALAAMPSGGAPDLDTRLRDAGLSPVENARKAAILSRLKSQS